MEKKMNLDNFLDENAITITIGGKDYVIKDMTLEDATEMTKEDSDKKAILAKVIGCPVKELDPYGAIGIMKIVTFINENLLPGASQ